MPATRTHRSMHHPRRRNVTTSLAGLKTGTYAKISSKMVSPRDTALERRRRRSSSWNLDRLPCHHRIVTVREKKTQKNPATPSNGVRFCLQCILRLNLLIKNEENQTVAKRSRKTRQLQLEPDKNMPRGDTF